MPENTINPKINLDASSKQIGISYLLEMGNWTVENTPRINGSK